uniref:Uncharacterized protein n=1 Tax=Octopus bimaculoides TaxID=37653 RepID=A0A0L8FUS3_OCTBM
MTGCQNSKEVDWLLIYVCVCCCPHVSVWECENKCNVNHSFMNFLLSLIYMSQVTESFLYIYSV